MVNDLAQPKTLAGPAYLTYTVTSAVLFIIGKALWGNGTFPLLWSLLFVGFGYLLLLLYRRSAETNTPARWMLFLVLPLAVLILQLSGATTMASYGDQGQLTKLLTTGLVWPRWLGGSAILLFFYRMWKFIPPLAGSFGNEGVTTLFIALVGSLVTLAVSMCMLFRWPGRMAAILPLASPLYLMFATGYDEYYPFIAGLFLWFLVLMVDPEAAHKNPYRWGLLLAILPVLYVPFLLISFVVLLFYWVYRPSLRLTLVATFVAAYVLMIALFWPGGIVDYFPNLIGTLNLGDTNTLFDRYIGQSAGEGSFFFKIQVVASLEHLGDLMYMFFWSGTAILVPVLLYCFYHLSRTGEWKTILRRPESPLLGALLASQSIYYVFMLPKWGPRRDIDLFFTFYLSLAFCAGYLLDFMHPSGQPAPVIDEVIIPGILANAVFGLFFLRIAGLPAIA